MVQEIVRMTFTNNGIPSSIMQKLYEQKKSNRFCDLTLFVNNRIIKAHRNVLASGSPYFDSVLKCHKISREQLVINCTDVDTFNRILSYFYTGEITIDYSNVEELLKLADHFIVNKIIEHCIEFLGTKLNVENCLFTLLLTTRFKLKHLNSLVENWIVGNLEQVCNGREILSLKPYELQEIFKNKIFVISAFKSLTAVSDWIMKDLTNREKHYHQILKSFQWNALDSNEVFKHLGSNALYNKSEFCLYQILHCLVQNNWMLSNYKSVYDELHNKFEQVLRVQEKNGNAEATAAINKSSGVHNGNKNTVAVKAKQKNRKYALLKRLMLFGLRPSLRMAALKMLMCKKKKLALCDLNSDDVADDGESDKVGIKCPICFANIKDSLLLEQHLALSHAKDVTYKCGICAFICQYHGDYLNHMKTHFSGPPFKCDYCETTTDQISKLISHRAQHLDESAFQCSFCTFKCRLKQNFLSHLKIHTPDKLYKCDSCTKTFRFKQNLEAHARCHSPEKNLSCETCGFHTKFLSHMIAHKRIHAGDVYRCSYPHCKYSTSKKNQLSSHAKVHNGVRPHSCGVCGRGFMEKSHLVRHERIHLEEKPFKCSNCDYASSRRDKLKEHFTRHHGENASAKVPYKARPMRNNANNVNNSNNNNTNSSNNNNARSNKDATPSTSSNTSSSLNFSTTNTTANSNGTQQVGGEIQDLIMHHQNNSTPAANSNISSGVNSNYHHFTEPSDFHHHGHSHNIQHQILSSGHNQRPNQHHNNVVNHHMLARSNHSTATSTAAAVAAAMMLDPRFHHTTSVPYHPTTTPVSMAMAAVQSSQQVQGSAAQHTEYPPTLQNCGQ